MSGDGFETRAIHAGQEADEATGAVVPAIYQVSTYRQDAVGVTRGGHDYSRTVNPTRTALETCLAALEGATHGF
ncbi:MAG TPA: PLP-dependent transferase, partial [Acidimicrobiales bacterium]|nr:PLP-dependent transferase [Acidimicrobiales bacterium]